MNLNRSLWFSIAMERISRGERRQKKKAKRYIVNSAEDTLALKTRILIDH
jgi:hypothetical protein